MQREPTKGQQKKVERLFAAYEIFYNIGDELMREGILSDENAFHVQVSLDDAHAILREVLAECQGEIATRG